MKKLIPLVVLFGCTDTERQAEVLDAMIRDCPGIAAVEVRLSSWNNYIIARCEWPDDADDSEYMAPKD